MAQLVPPALPTWGDVLAMLAIQSGQLDESYLERWAGELGVLDLLGKAHRAAAGSA